MDSKTRLLFTPNEITQLTETFDEICLKNKLFFNEQSLSARLGATSLGKRKKQHIEKLLSAIGPEKDKLNPDESSFGLQYLASLKTSEDVDRFCEIISFSRADLTEAIREKNMLSMVAYYMAGVFVQNLAEKAARGESTKQIDEKLAKQCESLLEERESYQMGKARTARIWNNIELVKKRGKPQGQKRKKKTVSA